MAFNKTICLDEEGHEIWKKRFGAYSQAFSKWVNDKLKEEHLESMNTEDKKKYIRDKEKEIAEEKRILNMEKINIKNIEKKEKVEEKEKEEENKKFTNLVKIIPDELLEIFRETKKITPEIITQRYNNALDEKKEKSKKKEELYGVYSNTIEEESFKHISDILSLDQCLEAFSKFKQGEIE